MGAKTALLAYSAKDSVESLRQARDFDPEATRALVAATHPAWEGAASSQGNLFDDCYPPEGTVYAGSFPGIDILCDRDVMDYQPSEFPARYLVFCKNVCFSLGALDAGEDLVGVLGPGERCGVLVP